MVKMEPHSNSTPAAVEKSPLSAFRPSHSRSCSTGSSRQNSRDWEVMTDIQSNISLEKNSIPGICEGHLMKKRKYPLQGWHKRYFILEKGILIYAKSHQDLMRGKNHGALDVSLAVMSVNKKSRRIDLDAGDTLLHLKAKSQEIFYIWMTKLTAHRVYKKNEALSVHRGVLQALSAGNGSTLSSMATFAQMNRDMRDTPPQFQSPFQPAPSDSPSLSSSRLNNKVSAWLQQTQRANACQQELARCQLDLAELGRLIQMLHLLEADLSNPISNKDLEKRISMQNLTLEKPKKKVGKVWGHSRTMSHGMLPVSNQISKFSSSSGLGSSLQSIPDYVYSQLSTPRCTSPEGKKLQQDIHVVSQRLHTCLKSIHEMLSLERERLTQAWTGPDLRQSTSDQLASLCTTLSELELQSHHTKVHSVSLSSDSSEESFCTVRQDQSCESRSRLSVAESMAEYFDAYEHIVSESLSENEASDESGLSDVTTSNSEAEEGQAELRMNYRTSVSTAPDVPSTVPKETGRRTVLPARCTDNSHIGILSILYNNIGKDLSRVSMPVALNEPLNFLQRVSEELEYAELLDIANHTDDPYERMVYMAVFSISGYAWASWRNRYKPVNPVLGETYESIREDRGFRYVAEQVSHHPPVSACHAESENFTFWQDQRWKYKFWGKSVEIISSGLVNVSLPRYGDHYQWNKAVTCIHNVFSQQRWLEHYGDVVIQNLKSDVCSCKLTFVKSRYGDGENKNEVQGVVLDQAGKVVHRFGGSWHEGIFCDTLSSPQCLWKPNPQPEDYFEYYGFSRYARELNELTPELKAVLPPTDTRFRPDQRLLENGKVAEADKRKDEVEEKQRERRKELAKRGEEHIPRFFRKTVDDSGREVWVSNATYWRIREDPGFANTDNLELW
ncbi:oxysterol-binding protein-related protein 6-like [Tachysurus fulvidraco]|uniref:oxysterol-binding protein-related protein 6-like n=1 Tax=Tachysurus fulvidraco TaxID=1234273 RepID=UPI001FEEF496|nr:oxysterol-binding protein-related protein 6-like [Tachysurus fulvidraco]